MSMLELQDTSIPKAIAVGVSTPKNSKREVEEHLSELAQLAETAGIQVVETITQDRRNPDPATYIGSGKVHEVHLAAVAQGAEVILFDDELSPAQQRNLEKEIGKPVTDRTGLILDIFSRHARSRMAKTQVELAQLQYTLPRLTGMWSHFSKQRGGGANMKGEGETQLEMDKRMIKTRMAELRRELADIAQQAAVRRKGREDVFKVSLVGYTNAGKSTLMNALTEAGVLAENKLFATLDTTMRQLVLPSGIEVVLSDTVGFIRKLPHQLVASFRSTLDEVVDADLLLHVVDASHPEFEAQVEATESVLGELGIEGKPTILVFNKVDALPEAGLRERLQGMNHNKILVSAKTREGLDELLAAIQAQQERAFQAVTLLLPHTDGKVMAMLHQVASVLDTQYEADGVIVKVKITPADLARIESSAPGIQRV
jgi:GTP-binding protein HflX